MRPLAVRLSRTISVADLVQETKNAFSKWVKTQDADLAAFFWQQGYGAYSIGTILKEALLRYIDTQEEHHQTRSSQDEYRESLRKYACDYDERYVWD